MWKTTTVNNVYQIFFNSFTEQVLLPYAPNFQVDYLEISLDSANSSSFIYGKNIEAIMENNKKNNVPKNIEFIGSLAEYVSSLPNVEEDWFCDALLKCEITSVEDNHSEDE